MQLLTLDQVNVLDFDTDHTEIFNYAENAVDWIKDNQLTDFEIVGYFSSNGMINSASLDDNDYHEELLTLDELQDLV